MRAFLSYQTGDKQTAREIKTFLESLGIQSFLAHEDIEVSEEWAKRILGELRRSDIFFAVLSKRYYSSVYCVQESGLAIFNRRMTIVPLSIDGSVPRGFISHIQSTKIPPTFIDEAVLFRGLAKHKVAFVIEQLTDRLLRSGSREWAEFNMNLLSPYLNRATPKQITGVFLAAIHNPAVGSGWHSADVLRKLLKTHGNKLTKFQRTKLTKKIQEWLR